MKLAELWPTLCCIVILIITSARAKVTQPQQLRSDSQEIGTTHDSALISPIGLTKTAVIHDITRWQVGCQRRAPRNQRSLRYVVRVRHRQLRGLCESPSPYTHTQTVIVKIR
uniref:Putative secreted peptide n=1 Tax=Anopheles braziliensis TaxID=58242 RepID=A0A2M3ZTT9_9DIPT